MRTAPNTAGEVRATVPLMASVGDGWAVHRVGGRECQSAHPVLGDGLQGADVGR